MEEEPLPGKDSIDPSSTRCSDKESNEQLSSQKRSKAAISISAEVQSSSFCSQRTAKMFTRITQIELFSRNPTSDLYAGAMLTDKGPYHFNTSSSPSYTQLKPLRELSEFNLAGFTEMIWFQEHKKCFFFHLETKQIWLYDQIDLKRHLKFYYQSKNQ